MGSLTSFFLRLRLRYLMWKRDKLREHLKLLEDDLAEVLREINEVRRRLD